MGQSWVVRGAFALSCLYFINTYSSAELIEVNRVVGRVNDKIITMGDIAPEIAKYDLNLKLNGDEIEKLDGRIDRLLCSHAFDQKGMTLPESYIESRFNHELLENFSGNRLKFRRYLQSEHMTVFEYKEQLKEDIIYSHMLSQRKRTTDETSPQSVEDYYRKNPLEFLTPKKVHLQELLFSSSTEADSIDIESFAHDIYSKLKKGEDFYIISSNHKNCQFTDWKFFVPKDEILDPKTRDIAFSLNENEFSEPFPVNQSGKLVWKILKVFKVQNAQKIPVNEVRNQIEKLLARQLEKFEQRKWLSRQKRDSYVNISLPD